jgi:hypothetical protein
MGKRMNSHNFRLTKTVLIFSASVFIHACATGPKYFSNENPHSDFSVYKTYNYQASLDTDKQAGTRSILSNYLVNAVDREMQAHGYQKSGNPDLEVQFSLNTKEKISSRSTSPSVSVSGGYYGYRGRGGYGTTVVYSEPQIRQYTEGTLNIDLVDNAKDELAWEGVAIGRIRDEARANMEVTVNQVVTDIFLRYPHYAAGYTPSAPEPE